MQYGMIIDLDRCVGCHACTIACKAEWEIPADYDRNWVYRLGPAISEGALAAPYYPGLCNHCEEPPCITDCPADPEERTFVDRRTGETVTMEIAATWKDPFDGTVQIDKRRCVGCGACVEACPYQARYLNPTLTDEVSDDGKADKCTFCQPRLEAGLEPACVQTCITGARIFGDISDQASPVADYIRRGARSIETKDGALGPHVYYFGKEKDLALLFATYTPELAQLDKNRRRALLAGLIKPAQRSLAEIGLLSLAGIAAVKSGDDS